MCLILINCGGDSWEKSKIAFEKGEYNETIKNLKKVKGDISKSNEYYELFSLSYMYRGKQLFEKTKNIDIFKGNFHQSQKVIPKESSDDFKQNYSQLLLELANGYQNTQPKDFHKKEKKYEFIKHILQIAIEYDSTNATSHRLLSEIEQNYFTLIIV